MSEIEGGVQPYKPTGHRHIAEIERSLARLAGEPVPVTFTPHYAPHSRGLEVTCYARLRRPLAQAEADALYRARYDAEPFVSVEERVHPGRLHGANSCHVGIWIDERTQTAICAAAHRQPRQGRGRTGDPERQPRARPGRGRRPDRARAGRMSVDERIGVCFPRGFRAAGVTCGIKDSGAPDLALLACDGDATAAGAFTRSRLAAAPVLVSREHLADGRARAVVVNSGNANACTGAQGMDDARTMASATARALGIAPGEVVVCSTGVIGKPLPMEAVAQGIARAAGELSESGGAAAADAIRTTDAWAKTSTATVALSGGDVRIGVMGKGAGMIRPDVATTIVTATTDAVVEPAVLGRICCATPPMRRSTSSRWTAPSRPTTRSSCSRAAPAA